jgi:hypothetical protein
MVVGVDHLSCMNFASRRFPDGGAMASSTRLATRTAAKNHSHCSRTQVRMIYLK